jgi:hypothetical protein
MRPIRLSKRDEPMPRTNQSDLFGDAQTGPKPYVPKPEHVRNSLQSLVTKMQAAETWPWNPSVVDLHRERTFAYLCGLLPDQDEAERWRALIEAEIGRLDAAA